MKSPLANLLLACIVGMALPARSQTLDSDGNGVSDLWQSRFLAESGDLDADSDGDGVSDRDEALAGTDPLDPASVFRVVSSAAVEGATGRVMRLTLPTVAGKIYQIQRSPALQPASWTNTGPAQVSHRGGLIHLDVPLADEPPAREFFRAKAGDIDEDQDGLTAWEELQLGLSDNDPDSSGHPGGDMAHAAGWLTDNHPGVHPGGPQANLREVDVAWVRHQATAGPTGGSVSADAVAVVGTGEWHQFTSWRHTTADPSPSLLRTMLPLDGTHPKVHFLNPGPVGLPARFATGRIRPDGNLWLSSRGLDANGNFIHYQTVGFGSNVDRAVEAYDIAHRAFLTEFSVSHYVVVTPVLAYKRSGLSAKNLRVATWRINALTGALTGVDEALLSSGTSTPNAPDAASLRIARLDGNRYQIVVCNDSGNAVHWQVETDSQGHLLDDVHGDGGYWNTSGTSEIALPIEAADPVAVSSGAYLTAHRKPDGTPQFMVFERRQASDDTPPNTSPFRIADNELDLTPLQNGVTLAAPVLTNSWLETGAEYDQLGNAVATGDFNGDGHPDLLAAASRRNIGESADAGAVYVIHGTPAGIFDQPLAQTWRKGENGVPGTPFAGDLFGYSLAVGDFNGDGYDDAAIGIPNEEWSIVEPVVVENVGAVQILVGSPTGLSAAGGQKIRPAALGIGFHEGLRFGAALAAGDFNGDGRADLAIGLHGANDSAGGVVVLAGAATGLATSSPQLLAQGLNGAPDTQEPGDAFGKSLTAGDFNGDGRADLAVGVPGEDLPGAANAGAVQIYHGGAAALTPGPFITQDGFSTGGDIASDPEEGEAFGNALASGDFNGDGRDDLAVSAPRDNDGVNLKNGLVQVLYGGVSGLSATNNSHLDPLHGAGGSIQTDIGFGEALAAGDLDGDGHADLVIGAPRQAAFAGVDKKIGVISIIRGEPSGMAFSSLRVHMDSTSVEGGLDYEVIGAAADQDFFGSAVVCADFDSDGRSDLVVGVPGRDRGENREDAGQLHLFAGSASNTITFATDEAWWPRHREEVRAMLTDLDREESGGIGTGKIYGWNENLEWRQIASSTKIMTLLLAVEAIEDGIISLGDMVTVGQWAGTHGGSKLDRFLTDDSLQKDLDDDGNATPFLQPGDALPLRLLLAAMMNQSCNRSSIAIGEHVAAARTGEPKDFVILMNQRGADLGMTQSVFGNPAGGCASIPQDMITLQRECVKHPLFIEFGGLEIYRSAEYAAAVFCGTDALNATKCTGAFPKFMNIGAYPGRLAWKSGNTGVWATASEANGVPPRPVGPWATASSHGIVERLGRTFAVSLLQTGSASGDAGSLFDYGLRSIFTPDLRAVREFPETGGIIGPEGPVRVKTFALDHLAGGLGITAVIDDHEDLRLTVWNLDIDANAITPLGGAVRQHALKGSAGYGPPNLIEVTPVSSGTHVTDLFSGNLDGETLQLNLWRVGSPP